MKSNLNYFRKRAFTLIEMAVAMALTLTVAAVLLGLIQQQLTFGKALRTFSFLRDEAPQLNTLLTSLVTRADNYRIFTSLDSAKGFTNAVRENGKSLRLRFRRPDGTADDAIVSFETRQGQKELNYYFKPSGHSTWPITPRWTISSQPEDVNFDNTFGILQIKMTGPNGDEITYAGNPE